MALDPGAAALLRALQAQSAQQAAQISQLMARLADNERRLTEGGVASGGKAYNIRDLPGKEVPYWGLITIAIPASSTSQATGTHTVSMDGPLCVTDLYCYWRPTGSATEQNRWRPVSSVEPEAEIAAGTWISDNIDFTWKIEDGANDRARMSGELPSALLSNGRIGTGALPVMDVFNAGGSVRVTVTPIRALAANEQGTLYFVLGGFRKLLEQSYSV